MFARNGLIALLMALAFPASARAEECLPSAVAVRDQHPGAWPRWTLHAPGHVGAKCWYAVGRSAEADHGKRGIWAPTDEAQVPISQAYENASACADLDAEILANNRRVTKLAAQNGWEIARAGGTDLSGLYIWPVAFATVLGGEGTAEATRLQNWQQDLAMLVAEQCRALYVSDDPW